MIRARDISTSTIIVKIVFLMTAFAGVGAAQSGGSDGQTVADPWAGIEEMVVTGQGTALLVSTESDSVMAFDSDMIVSQGFSNIADVSAFTPNLEIKAAFGAANPTLFIRGVGLNDYLSNAQSSVAVYNDGVYMQSPTGQLFGLFDTQGIEVLRGPQGSLNGRNATAGAILVGSNKPSGDFGAMSRTKYGRFNQIEQEAFIEFPIVEEVLAARFAGRLNRRDGIVRNRCATPDVYDLSLPGPNQERTARNACINETVSTPEALERDLNNVDNWAARGIFQLQLGDTEWLFNGHGGESTALATAFQTVGRNLRVNANPNPGFVNSRFYLDPDLDAFSLDPTDGDPYAGDYNRTGKDNVTVYGGHINGKYDNGDDLVITSITALEGNERDAQTDPDSSPFLSAEVDFQNESLQLSQSVDLEWKSSDLPLTVYAGGLFLYEKLKARNEFRLVIAGGGQNRNIAGRTQALDQETTSWGIYARGELEISDSITLSGGARYNWDRKDFALETCGLSIPFRRDGPKVVDCGPDAREAGKGDETWTEWTGDAELKYRPTEDITFYVKYVKGWKPGQFNGATFAAQIDGVLPDDDPLIFDPFIPVDPETIDSFEAGFKFLLFDEMVKLSGAGFVYRYADLQVFRLRNQPGSPPINELINASDAQIAGVELEFEVEPTEGLVINGAFAWLESKYLDFDQTTRRQIPGSFPPAFSSSRQDYSGSRLIASPEFSFSGGIRYDWAIDGLGTITPRFDFSWRSEIFFDPNEGRGYFERNGEFLPGGTLGDDDLALLHAQLSYATPEDRVTLTGWVRNLTDEAYKVDGFDLSDGFDSVLYVIGVPRTYGLTAEIRF